MLKKLGFTHAELIIVNMLLLIKHLLNPNLHLNLRFLKGNHPKLALR